MDLKVEFRAGGNLRAETCPEPLLAGEEAPLGPERSCSTAGTAAGQDRQQPRPSPPWGRQKLGGRFVHRGGWSWAAHRHRCRAGGSGVVGRWGKSLGSLPSQATTVEMTLTTKVLPGPTLSPLGDGPEPPAPGPESVPSRDQAAGKEGRADLPRWQERGPGFLGPRRSKDN